LYPSPRGAAFYRLPGLVGDRFLFSSAQAFKCHADFEKTACVILDINLNDGLRSNWVSKPQALPCRLSSSPGTRALQFKKRRWGLDVSRSDKAILSAGTDRAAQESIGKAFVVEARATASLRRGGACVGENTALARA
jgi:hypothetical protein